MARLSGTSVSVVADSPGRDSRRTRAGCSVHPLPQLRRPPCFLEEGWAGGTAGQNKANGSDKNLLRKSEWDGARTALGIALRKRPRGNMRHGRAGTADERRSAGTKKLCSVGRSGMRESLGMPGEGSALDRVTLAGTSVFGVADVLSPSVLVSFRPSVDGHRHACRKQ